MRWPAPPHWRDLLAGLSVAGLLLPEAVAYAGIGNMPAQAGVLALFAGLLSYGLLGASRFAIVSATSSSAAVLLAATGSLAAGDLTLRLSLAAGLVMITGVLFLIGAMAKVGAVSAFIAKPVLRGFAFGLAVVIMLKQGPKLVGLPAQGHDALHVVINLWQQLDQWHWPSLGVGVLALGALFGLGRLGPRWPAALVVMLLSVAAQRLWHLHDMGVASVGTITLQLSAPHTPDLSREQWLRLGELAVAMVLILYAESYGSIRSLALRHGDATQPNRDLFALGVANVLSSLFHGMPVGAGYSASVANEVSGARTRWAGLWAAMVLLVVVSTLMPTIADIPEPVLAAIVIYAVSHTLDLRVFRTYFFWRRDRLLTLAAVCGVLWLGVLDGLLAAIGASLFMTLRGLAQARVSVLGRLDESHDFIDLSLSPLAKPEPGLLIVRPEAPLFFGNVESLIKQVQDELARTDGVKALILSLEETPDLDGTCVEALQDLSLAMAQKGQGLVLARLKSAAYVVLQRATLRNTSLTVLSIDDAVKLVPHMLSKAQ
jgi:MFS superfamily sulfate permease-like transporter